MQAGGRRFDPDQLHQPAREKGRGPAAGAARKAAGSARLKASETPHANGHALRGEARSLASGVSPAVNRLLFNNSEGKAFMESSRTSWTIKG